MEKYASTGLLLMLILSAARGYMVKPSWLRKFHSSSILRCTDFNLVPIDKKGIRGDADTSWQTREGASDIENIDHEPFGRPELITFDAMDTLIRPTQGIGKWYREALNTVCDMTVRLPRPIFFGDSFKREYKEMDKNHPCFGALSGMTSEAWWFEVIKKTYAGTQHLSAIDEDELDQLMPALFDMLYNDVFSTNKGWEIKEDVEYTLDKLKEWRDMGSGPKIGVISNFDERLPRILQDLEIRDYFDVIVTSHVAKCAKPDKAIFEIAAKEAMASDPKACYHIGDREDTDVAGAVAAGWRPMKFNENFDEDFPDWNEIETAEQQEDPLHVSESHSVLKWGRRNTVTGLEWTEIWGLDDMLTLFGLPDDEEKLIPVTFTKGVYEDE